MLASSQMKIETEFPSFLNVRNYNLLFGSIILVIYFLYEEEKFSYFRNEINRICSTEKDFKTQTPCMEKWFLARHYPETVVKNQIDKK